jgi:glycosyltransferase involved in cell wall biosynthesis
MSHASAGRRHVAVLGIKRLPALAGADRVVEHLLDSASPQNSYTVYLVKNGAPPLTCTSTRRYVYIPALKGKYLRAPSYFLLCCLHLLLKGDYDVAHVHNSDFGIFCPLLKLKRGLHVVGTFHGDPSKRDKWPVLAKVLLRLSESIFVRLCDTLTSVSAGKTAGGREIYHIPNGASEPTPLLTDGEKPTRPGLDLEAGNYVMFACGRLDRTKGLHHLLRAFRELPTDARLLVVGDFSHDARYSRSIEQAAASDQRVVLHRRLVDQTTLVELMRGSSVFVFPSEVEGMSMMLLEAIGSARLVVCSDIPPNVAVVGADYPFLFASGDAPALRAVLANALRAYGEGWDSRSLRNSIVSRFSWKSIAAHYEELYEACGTSR